MTELGVAQSKALAERIDCRPDLLIVSPFARARATGDEILRRWPTTKAETWPIQELTYLSPARCRGTTSLTRAPMIEDYWRRLDPDYLDGPDAESFASFVHRLRSFGERLSALDGELVVVVGHGQFFRAFLLGIDTGYGTDSAWMAHYRLNETGNPMGNCETVELSRHQLSRWRTTIMGSAIT